MPATTSNDVLAPVLEALDAIPAWAYEARRMVRVGPERRVAGHAFFPVGRGHAPGLPFPIGGVMLLGQDFGNERDLDAAVAAGEETDAVPTWREVDKVLRDADIPPDACWRTNYVMGVRRGHDSNCRGPSPGLRVGDLRRACRELFVRQLHAQRPCAVVVLGTYVPRVLAADFPSAFAPWVGGNFSIRDAADGAAIRDVEIDGVAVPLAVSILHPSMRGPNLWRRAFRKNEGAKAERALMQLVRAEELSSVARNTK